MSRVHYYTPIPDTRTLKDDLWINQTQLLGIKINDKVQLKLLDTFKSKFHNEYDVFPLEKQKMSQDFYLYNGFFGSVDAEILYSMIRYYKPKRIIEIGAGYSTYLAIKAIERNRAEDSEYSCVLTSIEPYPNKALRNGAPGLTRLITKKVQSIPFDEFGALEENDILFVDSSHVVSIGSDVQYEFLEILPRLNKGVLIHIHDIYLPEEYPEIFVKNYLRFWNEQYLLQAFLAYNDSFEVLWGSRYMRNKHPEKLMDAFQNYDKDEVGDERMSSFWIRRSIN